MSDALLDRLGIKPSSAFRRQNGDSGDTMAPKPVKNGNCVTVASVATPYRQFPTDALPEPVRSFVKAGSAALGVDDACIGAAILPPLASAISNAAVIRLKPGWTEPSVVWVALVGESGTLKSPVLDLVTRAIRNRQARTLAEHADAEKRHERDKAIFEADKKSWQSKGRAKGEPPPEAPSEPVCIRHCCGDITVEAVAPMLQHNPRGVLLCRDELNGWLQSFDQYKGGRGGDSAHWLGMHGARDLIVDRKGNGQKPIYCPRAAVSIIGGIQPEILRRSLGREHFANGMAARLLLAMPPMQTKRWSEATIDKATTQAVERLLDGLFSLPMAVDADGHPQPTEIGLSRDGKMAWVQFYNSHAKRLSEASGDHAAMLSKLEGYTARLALITHLVRFVANDPTLQDPGAVDAESIASGVALVQWFAHEAERVYGILTESEDAAEQRELVEWIERKGGATTARDLQRGPRRFRNDAQLAEEVLVELTKAGVGTWEPTDCERGRPGRVFRLATAADGNGDGDGDTNSVIPAENGNCVASVTSDFDMDAVNDLFAEAATEAEEAVSC